MGEGRADLIFHQQVISAFKMAGTDGKPLPPALTTGSNRLFQVLDLYRRSPKSSGLEYKSRRLKKTIFPPSDLSGGVAVDFLDQRVGDRRDERQARPQLPI